MNGIIVVFPKIEDGKSVRNLLVRYGYEVTAVCTQGAQVLNYIDTMNDGIIISGYRFPDMYYFDLKHSLTPGFDMLLMASSSTSESTVVAVTAASSDAATVTSAQTYDSNAPIFWAMLALISAMAAGAVIYRRRKENFMGSQGSADGTKSYD